MGRQLNNLNTTHRFPDCLWSGARRSLAVQTDF